MKEVMDDISAVIRNLGAWTLMGYGSTEQRNAGKSFTKVNTRRRRNYIYMENKHEGEYCVLVVTPCSLVDVHSATSLKTVFFTSTPMRTQNATNIQCIIEDPDFQNGDCRTECCRNWSRVKGINPP
jgi:hypothetical protein